MFDYLPFHFKRKSNLVVKIPQILRLGDVKKKRALKTVIFVVAKQRNLPTQSLSNSRGLKNCSLETYKWTVF